MGFVNDTSDIADIKTHDPKRGIVLRDVTPALPDALSRYALDWGGSRILFSALQDNKRTEDETGAVKFHMIWQVVAVTVPRGFHARRDEIKRAIADALDAFGEFHDRSRVTRVDVAFAPDAFEKGGD